MLRIIGRLTIKAKEKNENIETEDIFRMDNIEIFKWSVAQLLYKNPEKRSTKKGNLNQVFQRLYRRQLKKFWKVCGIFIPKMVTEKKTKK